MSSSPGGFGNYLPGSSPVHLLDPRTKLAGLVMISTAALAAGTMTSLAVLAAFLGTVSLLAKVPLRTTLSGLKGFFWLLVFTAVVQLFWARGPVLWQATIGPLTLGVTSEGINRAAVTFLRLGILITGTGLASATTSPARLGSAVGRVLAPLDRIGLPVRDAMLAIPIGLQFLPLLTREAGQIKNAQICRGIRHLDPNPLVRIRCLSSLFVPVVARAIRRSEELALAMVCRGYREDPGRSSLYPMRLGRRDLLAGLALAAVTALSLLAGHIQIFDQQAR